ncbi:MAG TPA: twin-arginine translocase TatA/TatE family subunit [Thermodesulfovibrionales bacterium]|nr:twin-arginine translocase TatA/TatE family subunit [Thermodesulfovibrionales bacterium]
MFDLGIQELIVIFVVALIVFGPKRLPELGKTLGKGLFELKKAMEGIKEQINEEAESTHPPTDNPPLQEVIKDEEHAHSDSAYAPPQGPPVTEGEETERDVSAGSKRKGIYQTTDKTGQERKEDTVNGR